MRERLGIDDIILILPQNRLQWYGHVLRKEDTDWVKKCMEYEAEGSRPNFQNSVPKGFIATWILVLAIGATASGLQARYAGLQSTQ